MAILELVQRDDVRLVTLTGPGGVGKMRFAWQVLDAMRDAGYETWFVSLADIRDPELAPVSSLTEGRSNRATAGALSISERTVENHVLHILTKLDLDSHAAAATWAVRNGLAE